MEGLGLRPLSVCEDARVAGANSDPLVEGADRCLGLFCWALGVVLTRDLGASAVQGLWGRLWFLT